MANRKINNDEFLKRCAENPDMSPAAVKGMIRGEADYRAGRMGEFDLFAKRPERQGSAPAKESIMPKRTIRNPLGMNAVDLRAVRRVARAEGRTVPAQLIRWLWAGMIRQENPGRPTNEIFKGLNEFSRLNMMTVVHRKDGRLQIRNLALKPARPPKCAAWNYWLGLMAYERKEVRRVAEIEKRTAPAQVRRWAKAGEIMRNYPKIDAAEIFSRCDAFEKDNGRASE